MRAELIQYVKKEKYTRKPTDRSLDISEPEIINRYFIDTDWILLEISAAQGANPSGVTKLASELENMCDSVR